MKAKDLIKLLEADGWTLERINGSHYIFSKDGVKTTISVPFHAKRDLAKGTLNKILKAAKLK